MPTLIMVYHSKTGGSRQMTEAAANAARAIDEPIRVIVKQAQDTEPDDLLHADGYLFCAPENLATLAGCMKDFFDRCYYHVLGKLNGRPYAAMICAGSDGTGARQQLERIAQGWRLKKITPTPIICTHAQSKERVLAPKTIGADDLALCADIGAGLATGMAMGIF